MVESLKELINTIAYPGDLTWIGRRTERRADMMVVEQAEVTADGLLGDHASKGRDISGKRAVTLIQAEHLAVIGAFLHRPPLDPSLLRRNLVVQGINLLSLKGRTIKIGNATLAVTGSCAPCSRMEEELGTGGYSAVRGHGGVTARVIESGLIKLGDTVLPLPENTK